MAIEASSGSTALAGSRAQEGLTPAEFADSTEPQLHVQDVSISYNTKRGVQAAVQNANLFIDHGSIVSLVGPSGCGKSTLLKAIAGYIPPTTGTISMNGKEIRGPGPDRTVVHQQTAALLPWFSVRKNVELALTGKGLSRRERRERAMEFLRVVDLGDFGDHAIYELSGGMQQRVALARALAADASIVLLDEPFGALDALQRSLMQDLLLKVWQETKCTFFLITHSVEEALLLGTHVVVMSARPGTILSERRADFGREALVEGSNSVKTSNEFGHAAKELLDMLTAGGVEE